MKVGFAGLVFGVLFGWVLGWARVTDANSIRQMLLLEDAYLFLMMGSGVATAFVGLRLLRWRKAKSLIGNETISLTKSKIQPAHIWGSAVFGTGWALSLACPGPVTAALGQGRLSALLIAVGIFAGVSLAAFLKDRPAAQAALQPVQAAPVEG